MKHNLKNRPRFWKGDGSDIFDRTAEEWFEGFEKELIEKLQSMEPRTPEHILIQEIFGEILGE